ncbi:S8 family serine peptidase [Actinoplanes sp. NPDC023936]|uniref:S8 family serine peptidase n=1 Tax=Actinoplanes sp. NPDC023936 TaxID=3154910 RepID=UPI0033C3E7AE
MRVVSSCLVAALLSVGLAAPALAADTGPVRIDVGLTAGTNPDTVVAVLGDDTSEPRRVDGLDAFTLDLPADRVTAALTTLSRTPGVRYAERGGRAQADAATTVDSMEIAQARTWTTGSPEITIAVVDTGVSPTLDLGEDRLVPGYDFVDRDPDASDGSGHGTVVAQVIAADVDNGTGGKGVCDKCRVMPVRVLQDRGAQDAEGTTADIAAGIVYAADHGAQIINLSLSTSSDSSLLRDAVAHAAGKGALLVASAGNVESSAHRYPADYEPVLSVGRYAIVGQNAVDRWVDVSAFANGAVVFGRDGVRVLATGSSAATGTVSGIAALILAMKPSATADEVRNRIKRTAELRRGQEAYDPPVVNAARAVYESGGTDTVAPVLTATGFTENRLAGLDGAQATPSVTDDHGVDRVEYVVGGKVLATVTHPNFWYWLRPPVGYTGSMAVTVRAYDYAGNKAEKTTTIQVDAVAPAGTFVTPSMHSVVHGKVPVVITSPATDVNYIWGTDEERMTRLPGTNRWTGTVDLSKAMGWTRIEVLIHDKAGNQTVITRDVTADNEAPEGGVVTPASGKRVRGTFTSTLSGVVDDSGVVKAQLWANGKYIGAGTSLRVNTGTTNGNVNLVWRVTDKFDQSRTLPTRTLIADNAGPTATVLPAANARVRGTFTTSLSGVKDASGVAKAELWANGKYLGAGYSKRVATGKTSGNVKLTWKLTDKLGNSRTYTRTVVADNKAPSVSITKAPKNKAKVKGAVRVYVKASDPSGVARVELIVNGKVVATDKTSGYVLSVNTKKQKKSMKVQVRAYDKLGNVTTTTARTWRR